MDSTKGEQVVAEVAWLRKRKICKWFDHILYFRLYYTLRFVVASLHDISCFMLFCALTLDIPYTTRSLDGFG